MHMSFLSFSGFFVQLSEHSAQCSTPFQCVFWTLNNISTSRERGETSPAEEKRVKVNDPTQDAAWWEPHLRQAETWDLGPGTWDSLFQQQNSKKLYGTKNARMCSWDKFWTQKKQETKKPNCHFGGAWSKNKSVGAKSKAGYWACPLHTTPPKLWAKSLRHPSGLTLDTPLPSAHKTIEGTSLAPSQKTLFSLPWAPVKPLPEFLVWPLITFDWLRRTRLSYLVGNMFKDDSWKPLTWG